MGRVGRSHGAVRGSPETRSGLTGCPGPAAPDLFGLEWEQGPSRDSPSGWIYGLSGLGQVRTPEENRSFLLRTRDENEFQEWPEAQSSHLEHWQGRRR